MTREEIIDGLEIYTVGRLNKTKVNITVKELQRFIDAIKALEQDPIDKIKTEIKGMTPTYHNPDWSIIDLVPISEVLKILDKYKTEIESQESEEE